MTRGACRAESWEGLDWSNQVMGPLLESYLKIKKRREIWSRTRCSRQRPPKLPRIREAQRLWHETSFQRAVQQAAPHTTASDIPVVPLATPVDWPEDLYLSHLGFR